MELAGNVYKSLEDIVGSENISDDPAVLDSYRYSLAHTAIHLGPYFDTFTPRGAAVLRGVETTRPRQPIGGAFSTVQLSQEYPVFSVPLVRRRPAPREECRVVELGR